MKQNSPTKRSVNTRSADDKPDMFASYLLVANGIPLLAVMMTYMRPLPLGASVALTTIGLGLIVAIVNLVFVARNMSLGQLLRGKSLIGLAIVLLSVGYIAWTVYIFYGLTKI